MIGSNNNNYEPYKKDLNIEDFRLYMEESTPESICFELLESTSKLEKAVSRAYFSSYLWTPNYETEFEAVFTAADRLIEKTENSALSAPLANQLTSIIVKINLLKSNIDKENLDQLKNLEKKLKEITAKKIPTTNKTQTPLPSPEYTNKSISQEKLGNPLPVKPAPKESVIKKEIIEEKKVDKGSLPKDIPELPPENAPPPPPPPNAPPPPPITPKRTPEEIKQEKIAKFENKIADLRAEQSEIGESLEIVREKKRAEAKIKTELGKAFRLAAEALPTWKANYNCNYEAFQTIKNDSAYYIGEYEEKLPILEEKIKDMEADFLKADGKKNYIKDGKTIPTATLERALTDKKNEVKKIKAKYALIQDIKTEMKNSAFDFEIRAEEYSKKNKEVKDLIKDVKSYESLEKEIGKINDSIRKLKGIKAKKVKKPLVNAQNDMMAQLKKRLEKQSEKEDDDRYLTPDDVADLY